MRRVILTIALLLMGLGLLGGAIAFLVGRSRSPLDDEVGTHSSAAGAVLGVGLIIAAVNPSRGLGWVRAGILYGFVILVFEGGSYFLLRRSFHLGPVIFGLAFSLLLIATYPLRTSLLPSRRTARDLPVLTPMPYANVTPVDAGGAESLNEPEKLTP